MHSVFYSTVFKDDMYMREIGWHQTSDSANSLHDRSSTEHHLFFEFPLKKLSFVEKLKPHPTPGPEKHSS